MPDGVEKALERRLADLIDRAVAQSLDEKLGVHARAIDGMGKDLDSIAKQLAFLLRKEGIAPEPADDGNPDEEHGSGAVPDVTWQCEKCGQRLGFFDPVQNVLRIRYKDHIVYVETVPGCIVSTPCRLCGHMTVIRDEAEQPPAAAGAASGG